ncbi:MAG TPA: hypothetical protein VFZ09_19420 [Archangium sp.]|nr:hypothetical protein [Archangium sp.]HEX5748419.1 hypothetical protein [Archangium sp.]
MRGFLGDILLARGMTAEARECFLRQVPENARTLELARQRWGEVPV